jgi:hypothetical protein
LIRPGFLISPRPSIKYGFSIKYGRLATIRNEPGTYSAPASVARGGDIFDKFTI